MKVLSSVLVDTVSRIDVNGLGYGSDQGPGASQVGPVTGGAAHGGNGGSASAEAYTTIGGVGYGSATQPIQLGSGSGRLCPTCAIGSAGGGAVKLEVGETLTLDGYILANGNGSTGWHGGGAGGSVWLKAAVFGGSGTISAEGGTVGGPAYAGGGGGGRVALYAGTDLFTGSISAAGGAGFQVGGAGTLFRGPLTGDGGLLLIDGKGLGGAATPLDASFWPEGQVFDLTVMQTAWVSTSGTAQFGSVQILTGSTWTVSDKKSMTSLEVSGGSVVSHPQYPGAPAAPEPYRVDLVVAGDVILAESSAFLADGLGYGSGQGPGGSNTCEVSGGAGYAGKGGDGKMGTLTCTGGNAYGSAEEPTQLGSGSGRVCMACPTMGSSGGGAVLLTVGSTFLFDGIISVDGTSSLGSVGGGSGGSVFIQAGTLVGEGEISANGGSVSNPPNYGGGGSGGRIAVYVPISDQFLGQMFAFGGTGNQAGAPGTVIFTN